MNNIKQLLNSDAVFRNWTFSEEFKIPITFNLMQLQLQLQFLLLKKINSNYNSNSNYF